MKMTDNRPEPSGGPQNDRTPPIERKALTAGTISLLLLIILLTGAFFMWPQSGIWGHYQNVGLGVLLVILVVRLLGSRT